MIDFLWLIFAIGTPVLFATIASNLAYKRHGDRKALTNPGGLKFPPAEAYALLGAFLGAVLVFTTAVIIT